MTKCNAIIMNIVSILSKWHNFRLNSYKAEGWNVVEECDCVNNKVNSILYIYITYKVVVVFFIVNSKNITCSIFDKRISDS